jgi:electron transfer flavoprotein alpha subunit
MVIAINTDPEAPIFDYADYCVVGDVQKIIPALIEAIRKKGSTSSPQVLEVQHA